MSQTAPGEAGGGGGSHSSNKFFHQPIQAPVRANFLSQGQGGAQYGAFIPHFPVKPTNPHMGNGYPRPHGPMQFNMHSSHMNPQHQHMHYINNMKGRSDAGTNAAATITHPYQQNHCGNLQYFSGGNYVTTVTVNPADQHHQNQIVHPVQQQQYVPNPQNYYTNSSGMPVMNPGNTNINNMQNMIIQQNSGKNINMLDNNCGTNSLKSQPVSVSNLNTGHVVPVAVEAESKILPPTSKEIKVSVNSSPDATSSTNQKIQFSRNSYSESLCEISNNNNNDDDSTTNQLSSTSNNGQKINSNSSNMNSIKVCCNASSNGSFVNTRPRTNSRCDSVRSETGESTCSSLSTESLPDQNHLHHHGQHSFNIKNNSHHQYHFSNNHFPNNHMQPMNDFNGNTMSNNGNMNYQNYMPCQTRMNPGTGGKSTMYNNPGIVQAFQQINTVQHVHVQQGQVQIMQQQYQALQGPGMTRPAMGMINTNPQGQTPTGNGSLQGQNMNSTGMTLNHTHGQNMSLPQNCVGHSGPVVPAQNFGASTHGQFPPMSMVHPQGKVHPGLQQQNMMIGMPAGPLPGTTNPINKPLPTVVVPFGWKRINNNGQIVYISPSGSELRSPMEVCEYLTQEDTCKCGLQCPLRVENIFCFDPKVLHRLTTPEELSSGEATKVCNHRRKLALAFSHHLQKQAKKEDGRKKRKRKGADESLKNSSTPSPAIGQPSTIQMVPFTSQVPVPQVQQQQQQPQDPSQIQQHQQQLQQQPHNIYQPNTNQTWNGMYGIHRVMVPNAGMSGCQSNSENYSTMNVPQGCNPTPQFANQHSQNCCENHYCFPGHQNPQVHQGVRPPFGPMNRPPFCRMTNDTMFKGMVPSQGACIPQQLVHHPMVGPGNRPSHPSMATNAVCRMPVNTSVQMYGNGQGVENSPMNHSSASILKMSNVEETDKRRKMGPARTRKKAKLTSERNSPCPNIDVRSLRSENAISPHTGPGPPFHTHSPIVSQSSSDHQMGSVPSSEANKSHGSLPVSGPSFMEDPNGYLAQQTVLLNNTMAGGGVGQFSPQGARLSPRPSAPSAQGSSVPPKSHQQGVTLRTSALPTSKTSPTVVPLPSNVPLPARVSKGCAITTTPPLLTSSSTNTICTSVHSKSSTSLPDNASQGKSDSEPHTNTSRDKTAAQVATAESSFVNHTVTVTYTHSSVTTTTCGSESNSPHSSQDTDQMDTSAGVTHSEATAKENQLNSVQNSKIISNITSCLASSSSNKNFIRSKASEHPKKSEYPDSLSASTCRSSSNTSSASSLSLEAANKPLTPSPAESSLTTQSPLEMVQNIVSSIPLPASSDDISPVPGKLLGHQSSHHTPEQPPAMHPTMSHQQVIGPHVYNMPGSSNMPGMMYNPNGGSSGMLRGAGSLVVHGATPSGSIPPGVLVSNSGNMVVVTAPFNSKVSVTTPVVCSNVSGIPPMVGVQTVPQVQVQPSLASVQSHQLQPHLQQIQPVQPVVQFVNTFATMQAPVIIQNGSNLIQSHSGVLSGHGGVIGPASLIPSSTPAFVTSQPLLAVDSSSHSHSQMQMTQVVTSSSSDPSEDNGANRLTPVATPASTPTTPHSTPGSETPPSAGSSNGSGRKRKRRRNNSTPQGTHQQQPPQPQSIVPAIIMGKQMSQQMVMNGTQISQVAPYGSVAGAQVATMAAMGTNGAPGSASGQMIAATGQPANSINVVQMVGGPVTGPLPVHVQQPHTILVPSTATPGVIINQLPDGSFVSTDPTSGVTYPVQLQLSGSHIVGVTPVPSSNSNPGVVGSLPAASSLPQGAVVAVRPSPTQTSAVINAGTKLLNISPGVTSSQGETLVSNVYGVTPSAPQSGIVTAPVGREYSATGGAQFPQQIQHPNSAGDDASLQQSLIVGSGNATLLQQKTTTIVAQQTTVVATQGGLMGTHSSVSTQTPGLLGESDVSSSDCVANPTTTRDTPISPSHQSAEVTTTKQDEDAASTPESLIVSPQGHSPESTSKKIVLSKSNGGTQGQEPHSATTSESGKSSDKVAVFWGFHRGHHYWPSVVLHKSGGEATVRWFGDYSEETVAASSLSSHPGSSTKITTRRSQRGRTALDEAIAEADRVLALHAPRNDSPTNDCSSTTTTSILPSPDKDDHAVITTTSIATSSLAAPHHDNRTLRKHRRKRKS